MHSIQTSETLSPLHRLPEHHIDPQPHLGAGVALEQVGVVGFGLGLVRALAGEGLFGFGQGLAGVGAVFLGLGLVKVFAGNIDVDGGPGAVLA